ncbi:Peptidoglycan-recognition protein SD [Pseudolycoriella hygida]|uniref:Peptidoglycan-recognition protein SD n=1 Tax=Pseudolycoriella hygida TaxID=35572 RepID=A0A9Q0MMY7_9DIPT|nr:Peptidoglycan-recognition protein SD [Pseudolycoriella hygida]
MSQEIVSVPNVEIREFEQISFHEPNSSEDILSFTDETIYSSNDSYAYGYDPNAGEIHVPSGSTTYATSTSNPNNKVAIKSSSGITVGNKNFFSGPVVIKQFFTDDEKLAKNESQNEPENKTKQTKSQLCTVWRENVSRFFISAKSKRCSAITLISLVIFIAAIVATVILITRNNGGIEPFSLTSYPPSTQSTTDETKNPLDETTTTFDETTTPELPKHEFINRTMWGALAPKEYTDLQLPVKRIIIAHTAENQCFDLIKCSESLRAMQQYQLLYDPDPDADVIVNFLVGGDGRVYEGRGYRVGAHTRAYSANRNSICIAFFGNFNAVLPTDVQLDAAKWMIEKAINSNALHPEYKLYGHRQFFAIDSPGHLLYPIIITWPHFSPEIVDVN